MSEQEEPWKAGLRQIQAEYARCKPYKSPIELEDEVIAAYGRLEETYRQWRKRQTMEAWIRIKDNQCFVNKGVLQPGTKIEITPAPGLWLPGQYGYDSEHQEHYWKADDEHFVGLIDGMKVRI